MQLNYKNSVREQNIEEKNVKEGATIRANATMWMTDSYHPTQDSTRFMPIAWK